jgi:hypothetical protein
MPFDQHFPRPFTNSAIRTYAPSASGVYGISNAQQWIYIGQTDNIHAELIAHLQEGAGPVGQHQPTGFVFEICDRAARPTRQDRLVSEYSPVVSRF